MVLYLLLLIFFVINKSANGQESSICYEKNDRYLKRNVAKIIDIFLGSSIKLQCHFCNEQDDFLAKAWYFRKRGDKLTKHELIANFNYETRESNIDISPSHTLHLKYFDKNNSGIYFCSYFGHKENIFTYVLDGVYNVKSMQRVGTNSEWYEFRKNVIDPTNYLIRNNNGSIIFPFEIVFSWSKWGLCKMYSRGNVRHRNGKCRIRPIRRKILHMISSTHNVNDKLAAYLLDSYSVSCQSIELSKFYPEISRIIRNVPEFVITESCNMTKPGTKTKKEKAGNYFKYNDTKHVAENGHLILTCPEVIVKSEIHWYKDNCLLNSSFRNNMAQSIIEPHLTIDAYNVLHILRATKSDEGIYACTVDGRNMQIFNVKVVTKYRLLNQDFIRYSIYLGFVLSLTVTCYCAGIFVAWQRRASFADPLNLMKKKYSYISRDYEPLLKDYK